MGLRQTISEWVTIIKEALDFGPGFPDAMETRRVLFAQESARLQHLLEQTQKACQEKDQLIARLQAVGVVAGNMVVDGPAYYIRKANSLEGPFCTSCFQRSHEVVRIASAPKPKGTEGSPADWVQCARCRTPFRSERISQYLNPVRVPAGSLAPMEASPKRDEPRLGSPTSQGTGPQDRPQTTEDNRPRTPVQSHPPSVLLHPPSDPEPKPSPPQAPHPAPGERTTVQQEASRIPSQSSTGTACVVEPKTASASVAVVPQESDTPMPVKTTRKPRKERKRDKARLGEAPPGQTGPAQEAPPSQGTAIEGPAPTPNWVPTGDLSPMGDPSALEAPSPSRTRSSTRKPKDRSSEKAMPGDVPQLQAPARMTGNLGSPEVQAPVPPEESDTPQRLSAAKAITHGEQIRYEAGPDRDNLGFWTNASDWAQWELDVKRPGRFRVTAQIAALAPARFQVVFADQTLEGNAPNTGDYGRFQKVEVGTVELTSSGKTTVAVRPIPELWQPINLKALDLVPLT